MPEKRTIVGALGGRELLVPDLVQEALAANARAKYWFTLLQFARLHADRPSFGEPDLRSDRVNSGVTDERYDRVIRASRRVDGEYAIPDAAKLVAEAEHDVNTMLLPLRAASRRAGSPELQQFERRLAELHRRYSGVRGNRINAQEIAALTSSDRDRADSLHLLVLDAHRALTKLQESLATEDLDGAKVYGLTPEDRPKVAAFMRGERSTARLKFDHPGLGTTATRTRTGLMLQNDIGQTQAHVLLVEVQDAKVLVTATDVHLRRLEFFQRLLEPWPTQWDDLRSRNLPEEPGLGTFYLTTGTFTAKSGEELLQFLEHLGSRLVFLIDWNRARKALRNFVAKGQAPELLTWAAREGLGHRAFLQLGGQLLLYDAMSAVIRTPLRFGERLDDILGEEQAERFVRFVLRECATGLLEYRSASLITERIRAELWAYFDAAGQRLLGPATEHAELVLELARTVRERLAQLESEDAPQRNLEAANLAKQREHAADERVTDLRGAVARFPDAGRFWQVIDAADDAADALEDATFGLTLLPHPLPADARLGGLLVRMGDLTARCAELYLGAIQYGRTVRRCAGGAELHELLSLVDGVKQVEREQDVAERETLSWMANAPEVDGKSFQLGALIVHSLEQAVDAVTHATLILRGSLMGELQ